MAERGKALRKRRTRQHIIADMSLNQFEFYVINAGFTAESTRKDYGYDLAILTFDRGGLVEPGAILVQLKASETLRPHPDGTAYTFDLDIRDYALWIQERPRGAPTGFISNSP